MQTPQFPGTVRFDLTKRCNMRCKWCYAQGQNYNAEQTMSLELAKQLFELVLQMGGKRINLLGGEPTVWSPLLDFLSYTKRPDIMVCMSSNALRFANDVFWRAYKRAPAYHVDLSLKATCKEQYQELTGSGQFDQVIIGMHRVLEIDPGGITFVASPYTGASIVDAAKLSMQLGATHFHLRLYHPAIVNGNVADTTAEDIIQLVKAVENAYQALIDITNGRLVIEPNIPLCMFSEELLTDLVGNKRLQNICRVHHRLGPTFNADGDVLLCNSLYDYPIGRYERDFANASEFQALWEGIDVQANYDQLTRYPSSQCEDCDKYPICAGGCPLRWLAIEPDRVIPKRKGGVTHDSASA